MIPKKINYCWFGRGEKPKFAVKCIESWKKLCPDYEIIEWNEDNFDVHCNEYTDYCYKNKKWAFLTDYVRLAIISENGGIYFDTDVELIKRPDSLLKYDAFFGFENESNVATGLGFGAVPGQITVKNMLKVYERLEKNDDGNYNLITCPQLNTKILVELGLKLNGEKQIISDMIILPIDYLNPYDDPTGKLSKTKNTISIHWYSKTWMDKKTILKSRITKPFHRIFGKNCFSWIKR